MPPQDAKSGSHVRGARDAFFEIRAVWISATLVILALIVGAPFLPHPVSQILAGLLTAGITTLVTVYATYHSAAQTSQRDTKEELTRYGLLAWRNLDSLQIKIAQQLQRDSAGSRETLQEWSLDVDQAKWAWRDLLREVFELEDRLQTETYELAQEYRSKIRAAPSQEEARKLEAEQVRQLARLASSSRLPLRIPTEIRCPYCGDRANVAIGSNPGDTAPTTCPSCQRGFNVHRTGDGTLFTRQVGDSQKSPLRYVKPDVHLSCLKAVVAVFAAAPGGRLPDWPTFFTQVRDGLQAAGIDPIEATPVQRWLFYLKAFRLLGPEKGLELVVAPGELVGFVEQRALSRVNGAVEAERFCEWLYGSNAERLGEIRALVGHPGVGSPPAP